MAWWSNGVMGPASLPLLQYSITPTLYPALGLLLGYLVVLLTNPVRIALRDGLRCVFRFKRLWLILVLLALAYATFQFAVFTPLHSTADLRFEQFQLQRWHWPPFSEVWSESLLHTLESVAGIFDAVATTYPLSVAAALLLIFNWRRLHLSLVRALRKQFGIGGWLIYLAVLLGAIASLCKPLIYWLLPDRAGFMTQARFLQTSAAVDTIAFIFEYLCAVYLQVYLMAIALVWIKGAHFREGELLRFAIRRFSFVLKWVGIVILASTLLLRVPLLIAYFRELPGVLDYLPAARTVMSVFIILFAAMQISLVLHNESLAEAFRAHWRFVRRESYRFLWFLLIVGLHYWLLSVADTVIREAAVDRPLALIAWKILYVFARSFVTAWLLASWVLFFRQCEIGSVDREAWIRY
jgi:hypothetical protein